ncbi:MAG: sulfite exporter TauE/SafE family protein [Gemmatimonadota bacterium]
MIDLVLSQALAAFAMSLLGGLHCAGMCGGFIGALQVNRPRDVSAARLAIGYHAGRITSYMAAGAVVGAIGGSLFATEVLPLQVALMAIGSVMLLVIGATLLGRGAWMKRLEPLGAGLWRLIAPLARRVYPPRSGRQALIAGLAWGWIPCGMVYAALPLALIAGGPVQGAVVMFAFGLGTLPNLAVVDAAVARLGGSGVGTLSASRAWLRPLAGAAIVVFGVSGLAHAARVAGADHPAIAALARICHR